jgi:protein TonB
MSLPGPLDRLREAFSPSLYAPLTSADWDDRFTKAVLVSAILHVLVIFGMHFQAANPKLFENAGPPLDVVLVNAMTKDKPIKADVLAQHNLDGGGNVDEDRQATSPLPASDREQAMSAEAEFNARMQALEQQTQAMMKQIKSDYALPEQKPAAPRRIPPAFADSRPRRSGRPQSGDGQAASAHRPEHGRIPEAPPAHVRRRPRPGIHLCPVCRGLAHQGRAGGQPELSGSGQAQPAVRHPDADGQHPRGRQHRIDPDRAFLRLQDTGCRRPSTSWKWPGPFPLPGAMRKKVDILGITRSWSFTRSDQLTSQ